MDATNQVERTSPLAQHLLQAIEALLQGKPDEQHAANIWLHAFAEQPQAAQATLELLKPHYPAEAQFFVANILHSIVKKGWTELEAGLQQGVSAQLRHHIEAGLSGPGALSWLALQRVIASSALVAAASGSDGLEHSIKDALHTASKGHTLAALELLAALADCALSMHQRQRNKAVPAALGLLGQVYAVVTHTLKGCQGQDARLTASALTTLKSWLALASSEASDMIITPSSVLKEQGELFGLLLGTIGSTYEEVAALATEILVSLISSGSFDEESEEERCALQRAVSAILAQRPAERDEGYLHSAAQIAASIASRDMFAVAGRIPEAVPLSALMLECVSCEHPGAVEAAVEYFDTVNAVPVNERHPQLGPPTYASLLPKLLARASYPRPFTSWQLCTDQDSSSFHDFREHVLGDGFEMCQALLKQHYLEFLFHAVSQAQCWQDKEAALFGLRHHRSSGEAGGREDELMSQLFKLLLTVPNSGEAGDQYLLDSLLQLLSATSSWVASAPQGTLNLGMGVVIRGLNFQSCRASASAAFQSLCREVKQSEASHLFTALLPSILLLLQDSTDPRAEDHLQLEADQLRVVQGLAFLLSTAYQELDQACAHSLQLGLPLAHQAAAFATNYTERNHAPADDGARVLALLAGLINKLEFASFESAPLEHQPAVRLLLACMPHLQSAAASEAARKYSAFAAALCQVFKCCIQAIGRIGEGGILRLVTLLEPCFQACPAGSLEVLTTAVGYIDRGWTLLPEKLGHMLYLVAHAIFPQLQGQQKLDPELAAAWFKLLSQFPVDFPGQPGWVASVEEVVQKHCSLALECLRCREESLLRQVIAFLRSALVSQLVSQPLSTRCKHLLALLTHPKQGPPHQHTPGSDKGLEAVRRDETAQKCIAAEGQRLVEMSLGAIVSTWPTRLVGLLAGLLYTLLHHPLFSTAVSSWFQSSMQNSEAIGERLSLTDRQTICALALGLNRSSLFVALMKDMAGIARRELESDVLLAYQL